ncbi:MAG: hypothetical protein LLH30_19055 [Candidatus Manganitrophus sp. SA1]|nr:hypothetical protein [Candidatus Manganitrophus morganii]
MNKRILYVVVLVLLVGFSSSPAFAKPSNVGFLVLAPDRGFLGNREVATIVDEFKRSHRAALALVGRDYSGVEGEYATYLRRAVEELKGGGAAEIVVIPLFPSQADPMLKKVLPHLPRYASAGAIQVAAPMRESHLLSQILLDRIDALSEDSEQERLVVLGIGATDEASESILNRLRLSVSLFQRDADRDLLRSGGRCEIKGKEKQGSRRSGHPHRRQERENPGRPLFHRSPF